MPFLLVVLIAVVAWMLSRPPADAPSDDTLSEIGGQEARDPELKGSGQAEPEVVPEEDAEPTPQPVDAASRLVIVGRVVDETRRAIAGAHVVGVLEGEEAARVQSDAGGAFELPLVATPGKTKFGWMRIRAGDKGADRTIYVSPDTDGRVDYGAIVLGDLHPLVVRVLRDGKPVAGADVLAGPQQAGRGGATHEAKRSDATGTARFAGLVGPKVGVWAVASGTGRAFLEVQLPKKEAVDLELPDDRTATIHVIRADTKEPVAGAEVHLAGGGTRPFPRGTGCLPPLDEIKTDADGRAIVSGLPQGYVWVVARAEGLAMLSMGMMVERVFLQAEQDEATVTLHPYRAVRFPIKDTGAGAPPEGTVLQVRRYQPLTGYDVGTPEARIEDGHLVLEPFPPGFDWGHVVAPDDRWAMWRAPQDKDLGEPVQFLSIYDVRVKLSYRDGTPAEGEILHVRVSPRGRKPHARTDAEGVAVFPRCLGETASVLWTSVDHGFGMPLGRVNLESDPGVQEFTIDRAIDIVVRVLVGGEARLPGDYEVRVPDLDPDAPPGGRSRTVRAEIVEDAQRSEVRFRWLPMPSGEAPPVTVRAEGMPEVTVTPVKGTDGVWRATADLTHSTTLRVRVVKPEHGRYWLQIERWNEGQGKFFSAIRDAAYRSGQRAVEGVHTYRGFTPGRYRLKDYYSDIKSEPFVITLGGQAVDRVLDLSASALVSGKVVVPEGENATYATVRIHGRRDGSVSRSNPVRVKADGSFEFRGRRGDRGRLVVEHPLLTQKEPMAVVFGEGSPVLHLMAGPELVFRIEGSEFTTAPPHPEVVTAGPPHGPVRVQMERSGSWSEKSQWRTAIAKEGRFRVGVPGVGKWSVRITQQGFVPHDIPDLDAGAGRVDLGTIELSRGATLTARLFKGSAPVPQMVGVTATLLGGMSYRASSYQVKPGEPPLVSVSGLGPGRFKVVVQKMMSRDAPYLEREIESDGETPIILDVRLP